MLQGVASSEFYRLQKARKGLDEFLDYLQSFFQMVDIGGIHHLFLEDSPLPPALLLITSDAGFLGKLNVSVVNSALERCKGDERLVVIGRQGARYIKETGRRFTSFAGISDEVDYKEAKRLSNFIVRGVLNKEFGRTTVIYPHFISFAVWEVQVYQLLPCKFLFPKESTLKESKDYKLSAEEEKVIVEPTKSSVIEYLVKVWITCMLYGIFWESKLSEWAARVIHLEESSYEIKQIDRRLHLQYFHLLHEISDKNIREIFASRQVVERGSSQAVEWEGANAEG